ncbi:hypothetical protein PG993_004281 [Apiospora rasikravindrae]|uniref:CASP-like protein n=1 Tax=Apiospora rasikravindrae TaxID=990691 RepID=A0ABR1TCX0_9PEZI
MSTGARSHFSEASFGSLDELNHEAKPKPSWKERRKSKGVGVGGILGKGKKKMSAPNNVTSGPSAAADDRNVWANHIKNGDDRTHVPPVGVKVFIIRVVQLVIAVVFLVLAAFAAFTLNMGNLTPTTLHTRVVEGLTNVFWLAAWASLASLASALNVARAGYYYVLTGRQAGIGADQPPPPPPPPHEAGGPPDYGRGPGGAGAGAGAGANPAAAASAAAATARSTIQAAKVAICVDAGLGAVIWVLFVITLIATSMSIINHRKNNRAAKKGKGPEVAEV